VSCGDGWKLLSLNRNNARISFYQAIDKFTLKPRYFVDAGNPHSSSARYLGASDGTDGLELFNATDNSSSSRRAVWADILPQSSMHCAGVLISLPGFDLFRTESQ